MRIAPRQWHSCSTSQRQNEERRAVRGVLHNLGVATAYLAAVSFSLRGTVFRDGFCFEKYSAISFTSSGFS